MVSIPWGGADLQDVSVCQTTNRPSSMILYGGLVKNNVGHKLCNAASGQLWLASGIMRPGYHVTMRTGTFVDVWEFKCPKNIPNLYFWDLIREHLQFEMFSLFNNYISCPYSINYFVNSSAGMGISFGKTSKYCKIINSCFRCFTLVQ